MVRYPHTAIYKTVTGTTVDGNGDKVVNTSSELLQCRVEIEIERKNSSYSGIVFVPKMGDKLIIKDSTIEFESKTYKIVGGTNYQSHTELILE